MEVQLQELIEQIKKEGVEAAETEAKTEEVTTAASTEEVTTEAATTADGE